MKHLLIILAITLTVTSCELFDDPHEDSIQQSLLDLEAQYPEGINGYNFHQPDSLASALFSNQPAAWYGDGRYATATIDIKEDSLTCHFNLIWGEDHAYAEDSYHVLSVAYEHIDSVSVYMKTYDLSDQHMRNAGLTEQPTYPVMKIAVNEELNIKAAIRRVSK